MLPASHRCTEAPGAPERAQGRGVGRWPRRAGQRQPQKQCGPTPKISDSRLATGLSYRRNLHRRAAQRRVARQRIHALLIREIVDARPGMCRGGGPADTLSTMPPAVGQADHTRHHLCADLNRHLDLAHSGADSHPVALLDIVGFGVVGVDQECAAVLAFHQPFGVVQPAVVAAKLALGHELPDLKNSVTQSTTACFEPALDYIVTKVPRSDLSKFYRVSRHIGSAMKSVGEVMAIGRTFEESLQKALRMVDPGVKGFETHGWCEDNQKHLEECLTQPSDTRINMLAKAFDNGMNVQEINRLTAIDPWFLYKLERIKKIDSVLRSNSLLSLTPTVMLQSKKSGFSDIQIAFIL